MIGPKVDLKICKMGFDRFLKDRIKGRRVPS